jgi:hypothetical protein
MHIIHPFLDRIELNPVPISQGTVSRVYESLCNQYIVKIPYTCEQPPLYPIVGKSTWYQLFIHKNETSNTILKYNQPCSPKQRHYSLSLIKQAERLNEHGETFKIQSFGLGHYPDANIEALVMDRFHATPFADLSLQDCLKYLPTLLYALCEAPHGNLSLENILIDTSKGEIHLPDPGCMIMDKNFNDRENTDYSCIYTANPAYYPVIPPSFFTNRRIMSIDSLSVPKLINIPDPIIHDISDSHEYPDIADQLALGIILYYKATGIWLFDSYRPDPLWVMEYSSNQKRYSIPNEKTLEDMCRNKCDSFHAIYANFLNDLLIHIANPRELNPTLSDLESELILSLIRCDTSFDQLMEMLFELKHQQ